MTLMLDFRLRYMDVIKVYKLPKLFEATATRVSRPSLAGADMAGIFEQKAALL